jgi:hypothetical protein
VKSASAIDCRNYFVAGIKRVIPSAELAFNGEDGDHDIVSKVQGFVRAAKAFSGKSGSGLNLCSEKSRGAPFP